MTFSKPFCEMDHNEIIDAILDLYDEAYSVPEIKEMMKDVKDHKGRQKVTTYFVKRVITNYGLGLDERVTEYYVKQRQFKKQWVMACVQVMASGKVK